MNVSKKNCLSNSNPKSKKTGYNWYKLGVSSPFDMNEPDRKFDIWLRLKFTGPSFPHGKKEKDKMKIHNGIAGIWAVHFFMFAICLLGYICKGR